MTSTSTTSTIDKIEQMGVALAKVPVGSLKLVYTDPKNVSNDLAVAEDVLTVVGVFFPEALIIEKVLAAIGAIIALTENGGISITPDPNPEVDAQTTQSHYEYQDAYARAASGH